MLGLVEQVVIALFTGVVSGLIVYFSLQLKQQFTDKYREFPFDVKILPYAPIRRSASSIHWEFKVYIFNRTSRLSWIFIYLKYRNVDDWLLLREEEEESKVVQPRSMIEFKAFSKVETDFAPIKLKLSVELTGREDFTEKEFDILFPTSSE